MNNTENRQDARVLAWRKRFGVQTSTNENGGHFELESADGVAEAPEERIRCAREEMKGIVIERFGGTQPCWLLSKTSYSQARTP